MRRLPYLVVPACLLAIVGALLIPATEYSSRSIAASFGVWGTANAVVGGLIVTRLPRNLVGWIMLGIGAVLSLALLVGQYAGYALLGDPSLPLGREAAWVTTWFYLPVLTAIVVLLLVFPLGRAEGQLRRWTARVSVVAGAVSTVSIALSTSPMDGFGDVSNPFAWESQADAVRLIGGVAAVTLALSFMVALTTFVTRLWTTRGTERQQLKWFAYAMTMLLVAMLVNLLPLGLDDSWVGLVAVLLGLVSVPASVAVAILRHRLYDIDVVIKRTLVYGSLTTILLLTYLGLVLGLRVLLDPVTGESDLAVAASTLAVAALFRPLRSRIQAGVDRRFFRARYDAGRTVESFSARLRQEVDLDTVSTDLQAVVRDTVQPTKISVWLRSAT